MVRARKATLPCIPRTIPAVADMLSSQQYCHLSQSLDGLDNLFTASGGCPDEGTAFVILSSKRMLKQMALAKKLFSDATFCTPAGLKCRQIWNIVKLRRHHIVPLARVLMQTKKQLTYELVLQKFIDLVPSLKVKEVMCDFEAAQESAWLALFPQARVHGCLFHSSKAIAGKAKKLKLKRFIRQNNSANSVVRSMCGLAFLPSCLISDGLKKLARRAKREAVYQRLQPHFQYFQRYWLPRADILSVFNCPDRTNNACESDNRTLRELVKYKHPGFFCFLRGVLESEDNAVQDLLVLDSSKNASRKRRSSVVENDLKVRTLLEDLFLKKISRTMQSSFNRGFGFDDDFGKGFT